MTRLRIAALVTAVAIAAGAFEPFYLKLFFFDRARLGASLTELQYRKVPHLRRFLLDVRDHTPPRATVALLAPFRTWDGGYEYCYARSMYILAGREVLPVIDPADRDRSDNVRRAEFVAAFRMAPSLPGFQPVWQGEFGTVLRRVR